MKKLVKRFVVRKYIMAKSAQEAIRKDRTHKPDDVWVDDEWKKENLNKNRKEWLNLKEYDNC